MPIPLVTVVTWVLDSYPTFYPYMDSEYCQDPLHCSNSNIKYRFQILLQQS